MYGIAQQLRGPSGRSIEISRKNNGGLAKCSGCDIDRTLCQNVGSQREALIMALGSLCSWPDNSRKSVPFIPAEKVYLAVQIPEAVAAADDYDAAVEALRTNRDRCTGSEEITRDGIRMIYCPATEQEYPA